MFICGLTEAIVPWIMVPTISLVVGRRPCLFLFLLYIPVFSSIVTVSFVHFIRNLPCLLARLSRLQPSLSCSAGHWVFAVRRKLPYLTSFMVAACARARNGPPTASNLVPDNKSLSAITRAYGSRLGLLRLVVKVQGSVQHESVSWHFKGHV